MNIKRNITHWGKYNLEGVDFYLEPETIQDGLCPFTCILNMPICPHRGLSKETSKKWLRFAYIQDETLSAKRCLKMIPRGLEITDEGLVFVHSKFMPSKKRIVELLSLTNALPLFIYGIDSFTDVSKFSVLTELMVPRPIYFSGDPYVPFPAHIKRL